MSAQRRAAVLGQPIEHSLSPVIHNAGYAAAGLGGWAYERIECSIDRLPGLIAGLGPEWAGLSLTMPLKEAGLAVADEVASTAAALGACNTLVRLPSGGWRAENTDAPGMVDALGWAGVTSAQRVAILGAGGTARAALAAAGELKAAVIEVHARRAAAVDELRPVAELLGLPDLAYAPWPSPARVAEADVVVSTLPFGVADDLVVPWRPETVVFDAVYKPWPTPLAGSAAAAGCRIVSGLDLLLAQAVHQFEMFTGVSAPVDAMRTALFASA
ncbi:shikimate dehydrogenase [Hamadaea flava]|uniref:Shikimate dehydrogenase n=1 Tax=Hamadaea flava TaxID=1742688 RepID=A0ABV8M2R3_9ACTN|nr:shikimate dehydrogenase [Hamadaea flava]MCP2328555.1 shikimate dehydrogenase [Hamadaea flava]